MKRLMQWLFRDKQRRLEISTGGKWFLLFTLLLGVVAINSGNNVIYLLESLLLSALLFSGILSELALSRLDFRRELRQGIAGDPTRDIIYLRNRGWLPIYCMEVGEWKNAKFTPIFFALFLPGKSETRFSSEQIFSSRGRHDWQGLALATSFPFGFARKLRLLPESGSRILWPAGKDFSGGAKPAQYGEWEVSPGELEEVQPWDDISRVHWPSSARTGRLLARPRQRISDAEEVELDLGEKPAEREEKISRAAGGLLRGGRVLWLRDGGVSQKIDGAARALDTLALLPKGEA